MRNVSRIRNTTHLEPGTETNRYELDHGKILTLSIAILTMLCSRKLQLRRGELESLTTTAHSYIHVSLVPFMVTNSIITVSTLRLPCCLVSSLPVSILRYLTLEIEVFTLELEVFNVSSAVFTAGPSVSTKNIPNQ